ncbi:hypothetical protein PM082_011444 [Marasmius tenuissimus]|nr:hypothetical protein PM082_011444 [Marasmius tenuissimus]
MQSCVSPLCQHTVTTSTNNWSLLAAICALLRLAPFFRQFIADLSFFVLSSMERTRMAILQDFPARHIEIRSKPVPTAAPWASMNKFFGGWILSSCTGLAEPNSLAFPCRFKLDGSSISTWLTRACAFAMKRCPYNSTLRRLRFGEQVTLSLARMGQRVARSKRVSGVNTSYHSIETSTS